MNTDYQIRPVGYVRRNGDTIRIAIAPQYRQALRELESFGHAQVIWWFHRFENPEYRQTTLFDPPFEAPRLGVFASLAPVRPNPLGLSIVRILEIDTMDGIIEIENIDAFNDTPVLDIKPYLPHYNRVRNPVVPPWAAEWPEWMPEEGVGLAPEEAQG